MSARGLEALTTIHREDISPVLHSLTADEWVAPSACSGWRTHEVVAHYTTNMKLFVDPDPQPETPEGAEPPGIEEMQDAMAATRREWSHDKLLAEYDQYLEGFLAAFAMFQEEPLASTEQDLGDLGTHQMHFLAEVFTFDHHCHLRCDLLAPGGGVVRDLPPSDDLRVRPSIDWMMAGLPFMCTDDLRVTTAPVRIDFTGPGRSSWLITPPGENGMVETIVDGGDGAATVTSDGEAFISWGTKRSDWRDHVAVTGDETLAAAVLDAINVV